MVLGVGSPLMGDDGLGVLAAQRLRSVLSGAADIDVLDGGTWGMQLLPAIEDARRLLVIDAVRDGKAPGSIVRLEKDELPRMLQHKVSPHQIDLREVFAVSELRGTFPPEAVVLGVQPDVVELREGLSAVVSEALPGLLDAVMAQLHAWGHELPSEVGSFA